MNKREELQKLVDEACQRNPDYSRFTVEFRGAGGWWAVADQVRYFGDKGEYLGRDFARAKKVLRMILA